MYVCMYVCMYVKNHCHRTIFLTLFYIIVGGIETKDYNHIVAKPKYLSIVNLATWTYYIFSLAILYSAIIR